MDITHITSLLGGVALFLYGMSIMGAGLEKLAGGKMQGVLQKLTSSTIKGVIFGTLITGVIQSSAGTVVICVGLVNSGIMTLTQSVGVIMGANIGTTVTGQLIRMADISGDSLWLTLIQPKTFAPVVAFIGCIFYVFLRNAKKKNIGQIMLGFGILFTGMSLMDTGVAPLRESAVFQNLFVTMTNPILGVLVGVVVTVIIQSSSASVGILQALTSTGAVTYAAAVPIIMGQNIGTTVTALISSAGANKNAKRTAFVHLYFNLIGTLVFLCGFYGLHALLGFSFYNETANTFGIAIVHTIFNIVTTAILLPFNRVLEKLAILTVPDSKDQAGEQHSLLDERLLSTPSVAVGRAMLTGGDMAEICRTSLLQAMSLTHKWDEAIADEVNRKEDAVDHYEDVLGTYLVKLSAKALSREDNRTINTLLHTINDLERISDHSVNLLKAGQEIQEKSIHFSHEAIDDLSVLEAAVQDIVNRTVDAFQKNDCYAAGKIEPLEQVVDGLVREVKTRHIARLQAGACTIEYGFVLDDLLTNYERIADHCSNIAVAMIEVSEDRFDTHEYLNHIKNGESPSFEKRYERYRGRYTFEPGPSGTAAAPEQKK